MTRDNIFHLAALFFPLLVGFLARAVMQGLKALSGVVDNLPPWAKQVTVVLIAALLSALGAWVGVDFGTTLGAVPETAITALLAAIFAMVTHNGAKLANLQKYGTFSKPHEPESGKHYGLGIVGLIILTGLLTMTAFAP